MKITIYDIALFFIYGLIAVVLACVWCLPAQAQEYPTELEWAKHPDNYRRYTNALNYLDREAIEVTLPDKTGRVDYVTADYAIEIDWGRPGKVDQAVGQALRYALALKKKPGIIFLLKRPSELQYVNNVNDVTATHGIRVWLEWVEPKKEGQR